MGCNIPTTNPNRINPGDETMKFFVYDDIDRMEIKFGFDMARLWWRSKPTPDGRSAGSIRFALHEIAYSLGIIKRGIVK